MRALTSGACRLLDMPTRSPPPTRIGVHEGLCCSLAACTVKVIEAEGCSGP